MKEEGRVRRERNEGGEAGRGRACSERREVALEGRKEEGWR